MLLFQFIDHTETPRTFTGLFPLTFLPHGCSDIHDLTLKSIKAQSGYHSEPALDLSPRDAADLSVFVCVMKLSFKEIKERVQAHTDTMLLFISIFSQYTESLTLCPLGFTGAARVTQAAHADCFYVLKLMKPDHMIKVDVELLRFLCSCLVL